MATIRYNPNGQKGRISYNKDIVSGIIVLSLKETAGIELVPSKSKGIKVCFEKEGVFADISVIAHYGHSVPELAYSIQQNVKQMVESMTKYHIAKVDVHIQSVIFDQSAADVQEAQAENQADSSVNEEIK